MGTTTPNPDQIQNEIEHVEMQMKVPEQDLVKDLLNQLRINRRLRFLKKEIKHKSNP